MSRNSEKRKYRPGFEALERKQLLSAAIPAGVLAPVVQPTAPVVSHPGPGVIRVCGTGKGIVIITS